MSVFTEQTNSGQLTWGGIAVNSNGDTMYAATAGFSGQSPTVYKSTDSGVNWTSVYVLGAPNYFGPVYCNNSGSVVAVAQLYSDKINVSIDGGSTWNQYSRPSVCPNSGYYSLSGNSSGDKLYVCGESGFICTSTDFGATWTATNSPNTSWQSVTCDSTGQNLVAVGNNIYYSLDAGATWTATTSTVTLNPTYSFAVSNSTGQYVYYSSGIYSVDYIYSSSDYGETWTQQIDSGLNNWSSITCDSTGQKVYALDNTGQGNFYSSTNYGVTWFVETIPGIPNLQYIVSNSNSLTCLLTRDFAGNSYLWTYSAPPPPPPPPPPICFKEGSALLSFINGKEEYVPIENIRAGTLVKTYLHGYVPVHSIGTSKIYNSSDKLRGKNRLYLLSKDKYPELTEDLIITGCHSVLVDRLTDKQRADIMEDLGMILVTDRKGRLMAIYDERADTYEEEGLFNIWHLALEHDDERMNYGVYANGGLLVETTSQRMLANFSGMTLM